jgi:hypothetical protein
VIALAWTCVVIVRIRVRGADAACRRGARIGNDASGEVGRFRFTISDWPAFRSGRAQA